jgi:2-keto-4-pentenoate hydratase/2-oxohepta-3-ene-1,7-dioic acid hydratase in catechol pathway
MFALETITLGARPTLALAFAGRHVPLAAAGARLGLPLADSSLFQLLASWDESWPTVEKIAARAADDPELAVVGARALPQLGAARKVICAGANYYQHLREMDVPFVKDATKPPFFFLKPATALVGPGRTLAVDAAITMLDWEVELAAIVGRGGRDLSVARALEHVAGYTVAIDVTARDRLFQPDSIFKFDFLAGKGQDGFCPTATGFLPAAFLPDPQDAHLRLDVNGVTKQDARTSDMIYSVAELVAWASRLMTLEPGDVLLTGSPEGVGFPRREFLKAGDVMRAALEPLGAFEVELYAKAAVGS